MSGVQGYLSGVQGYLRMICLIYTFCLLCTLLPRLYLCLSLRASLGPRLSICVLNRLNNMTIGGYGYHALPLQPSTTPHLGSSLSCLCPLTVSLLPCLTEAPDLRHALLRVVILTYEASRVRNVTSVGPRFSTSQSWFVLPCWQQNSHFKKPVMTESESTFVSSFCTHISY